MEYQILLLIYKSSCMDFENVDTAGQTFQGCSFCGNSMQNLYAITIWVLLQGRGISICLIKGD